MPATIARRLTKADRREQLLDVAADLVLTAGPPAVTMERLAERAGVSKALVYLHFDNAGSVLAAVYEREVNRLGAVILAAIDGPTSPEDRLRAAVGTYFDVVRERGALFSTLAPATTTEPRRTADGPRLGPVFVAHLFRDIFGLSARRAQIAAALFLGTLNGGVEAWALGELRRHEVEDAAVSVALHLASSQPTSR